MHANNSVVKLRTGHITRGSYKPDWELILYHLPMSRHGDFDGLVSTWLKTPLFITR